MAIDLYKVLYIYKVVGTFNLAVIFFFSYNTPLFFYGATLASRPTFYRRSEQGVNRL